MGASDFSVTGPYSYDDLPPGQSDPMLSKFSINHDTAYILPILKQALALNPALKFMANPWSPPAWMKTNGSMYGTSNGHIGTLIPSDYGPLAQYFVKFIQAYQAQGRELAGLVHDNPRAEATVAQVRGAIGDYVNLYSIPMISLARGRGRRSGRSVRSGV